MTARGQGRDVRGQGFRKGRKGIMKKEKEREGQGGKDGGMWGRKGPYGKDGAIGEGRGQGGRQDPRNKGRGNGGNEGTTGERKVHVERGQREKEGPWGEEEARRGWGKGKVHEVINFVISRLNNATTQHHILDSDYENATRPDHEDFFCSMNKTEPINKHICSESNSLT